LELQIDISNKINMELFMFNTEFGKYSTMLVSGLSLIALLQGCGASVDCNDSKSKGTAIEIIKSQLKNAVWYNQIGSFALSEPEITDIKTLAHNDGIKQSQCAGKYSFTYNGKPRSIDFTYDLAYLEDKHDTEVKVDANTVMATLMMMVAREAPQLSPDAQAEKNRIQKEEKLAQIKELEQKAAIGAEGNKIIEGVAVANEKIFARRDNQYRPEIEMVFSITNNTAVSINKIDYELDVTGDHIGLSADPWNYSFESPIKSGETVRIVIGNGNVSNRVVEQLNKGKFGEDIKLNVKLKITGIAADDGKQISIDKELNRTYELIDELRKEIGRL
jgi:hypothetical protein